MVSSTDTALADLLTARHARLAEALEGASLPALALNPGPTLRYLTGLDFHLMERPVVALFQPGEAPVLVLPALEQAKLSHVPFTLHSRTYNENPATWQDAFDWAFETAGLRGQRVGVEPRRMRFLELDYLRHANAEGSFVSGEDAVAALRVRKDDAEIAQMRDAVQVAQRAVQASVSQLKEGMTERALAADLIVNLLREGSGGELPFQPIVSFGENTANPHAEPTDRALRPGDLILIDWGANVHGYFSDLTRVFAFGEVPDELARIAEIVKEANAAARAVAAPGVACEAVDRAARSVIEQAGYGERFTHRTGHGLGLETHEDPYMRDPNAQRLEPGMTFTIEPGIYVPGFGGVRIEDDMVITETGAESLSDLPRELVAVGS